MSEGSLRLGENARGTTATRANASGLGSAFHSAHAGTTHSWADLDEASANDTDYAQIAGVSSYEALDLSLSDVADPQTSAGHVVRVRASAAGAGTAERVLIQLYEDAGATLIKTLANQVISRGAFTTYEFTLSASDADAITDYSSLMIRLAYSVGEAGDTIQVSWVELQVPEAPSGTPTPTLTPSTTPTQTATPTASTTPTSSPTPAATASPTATGIPGDVEAEFVYDGDGTRVVATINDVTTVYVGDHYELDVTSGLVTKYYAAGSQLVALRVDGVLSYLLADHLGSSSMTTDDSGALLAERRYKAWGEARYASGTLATDVLYTGQREQAEIGLYYFRARWYREASRRERSERRDDPALGRFAQADTIVPGGVPMEWDRYAYVGTTPSGGLILQAITIVRKGVAGRTTCRHTPELVPAKPTLRSDG